jgi:hypothetical protein
MENDTTSGFMLCPNDGMRFPVAKSRFVSMHTLARLALNHHSKVALQPESTISQLSS